MKIHSGEIKKVWMWFWSQVWSLSEWSGIGLGKFAPWVFSQMIGAKGVKIK